MKSLLISATHKSSGKTTLSMGLCAALRAKGFSVQPYKKGPDYIDPAWLSEAAGRGCINLDFHTMNGQEIIEKYRAYGAEADLGIVEGNKGLFDGVALDGSDSNAALAALLRIPVLLVIDCQGMTRGIAPLLQGYQGFADGIEIMGVILNKVGGRRHEQKLRAAVEYYTDLSVLGTLQFNKSLGVPERHLGLIPCYEQQQERSTLNQISEYLKQQVDIEKIIAAMKEGPAASGDMGNQAAPKSSVSIGVARDAAFGFYYHDDLDQLRAAGAELIDFRPTQDTALPNVDALFIGGGFPETHLQQLQGNHLLREEIRRFVDQGKPVYAECGGLMYLSRSVRWQGQRAEMAGALPVDVAMHERPQGRGYMQLTETNRFPWPSLTTGSSKQIAAHEFHYSALENIGSELDFAYLVERGHGIDGQHDGLIYKRVLASYAHQRHSNNNPWAERFVNYIRAEI